MGRNSAACWGVCAPRAIFESEAESKAPPRWLERFSLFRSPMLEFYCCSWCWRWLRFRPVLRSDVSSGVFTVGGQEVRMGICARHDHIPARCNSPAVRKANSDEVHNVVECMYSSTSPVHQFELAVGHAADKLSAGLHLSAALSFTMSRMQSWVLDHRKKCMLLVYSPVYCNIKYMHVEWMYIPIE